jgi:hypothetical protein
MKKGISLLLLVMPILGFAQKRSKIEQAIIGNYQYLSSDKLSGQSLELGSDHTFKFYSGGDLSTYHSDGKWILKKDTLILVSTIQKDDIPVQVKEEVIDSIKDYIVFNWVNNADNDAMIATLSFNGDTSSICDPLIDYNCKMKIGSVDSILLKLGNNAVSKWYKVRNRNLNKIKITVPVHDVLAKYLFLEGERFLFRNGNLYPVKNAYSTDMKTVKRRIILKRDKK